MTEYLQQKKPHRLIASDRVQGTAVFNKAGDTLGTVKNFMVAKKTGQAEYAVLEFGGVSQIDSGYYPIPWEMLSYDTDKGGYVVDLSRERLRHAPRHGNDFPEYDHDYGRSIFEYYRLPYPFI